MLGRVPAPATNMHDEASRSSDDGWDSSLDRLWDLEQKAELAPDVLSPADVVAVRAINAQDSLNHPVAAAIASQRKVQSRKLAQKRYRQRQKSREATELERMRSQLQKSLQLQSALKSEVHKLQAQSTATVQQERLRHILPANLDPDLKLLLISPEILTCRNESACLESEDMFQLDLARWKELYKVAVCSLSKALHGSQLLDSYVETDDQLLQLTVQVNFLLLSRMLTDLPSYTALHHSGLGDDAQLVILAPEEFMSAKLAVLNYSEEQIADLIVLKTLLVRRFQDIHQKRTATLEVLAQHAKAGEARLDTAHELTTASLTNLNAQTYQTYAEWHVAFRFGIHTIRQSAAGMVYSYPQLFGFAHTEALESRLPITADKLRAAAATYSWDDVSQYLKTITCKNLHQHVSLIDTLGPQFQV